MSLYLRLNLLGHYLEIGQLDTEDEEPGTEEAEEPRQTVIDQQTPMVAYAGEGHEVPMPIGFRTGYWGDEDRRRR